MVHQIMFPGDKICSWEKNCTKIDANDDKQASMTMNKREGTSHIPLYGISCGFSEKCRNIEEYMPKHMQSTCRVRAQYAQNGKKVMGPVPLGGGGVRIEERSKCSWYIIENNFKVQKQSFL